MNEPFENVKEEDLIKYLITDVYDRIGVNNISNQKIIYQNVYLSITS